MYWLWDRSLFKVTNKYKSVCTFQAKIFKIISTIKIQNKNSFKCKSSFDEANDLYKLSLMQVMKGKNYQLNQLENKIFDTNYQIKWNSGKSGTLYMIW